jgi:hypothetical protein
MTMLAIVYELKSYDFLEQNLIKHSLVLFYGTRMRYINRIKGLF